MQNNIKIQDMQKIAFEKGGKCLSKIYKSSHFLLKWRCSAGHIWKASRSNIVHAKSWCAKCAINSTKNTIEEMHKIAKKNGGECLSKKYVNADTKLEWKCSKGHVWKSIPRIIKSHSTWCPECLKGSIDDMHKIAKERKGKCLSKKYIHSEIKLKWQCSKGHTWKAPPKAVKAGSWCLTCSGRKRLTLKDMHKIAKDRNAKCLSKKYINVDTKLKWKCAEGHIFLMNADSIKGKKTWCPRCNFYYSEEICRTTLEQIFSRKFEKTRPKWLKSYNGNQMELDGYNKNLSLAFEYQGHQHFEIRKYGSQGLLKAKKDLEIRIKNDEIKTKSFFAFNKP